MRRRNYRTFRVIGEHPFLWDGSVCTKVDRYNVAIEGLGTVTAEELGIGPGTELQLYVSDSAKQVELIREQSERDKRNKFLQQWAPGVHVSFTAHGKSHTGTIVSRDGSVVTVKTRAGANFTVLAEDINNKVTKPNWDGIYDNCVYQSDLVKQYQSWGEALLNLKRYANAEQRRALDSIIAPLGAAVQDIHARED